MQRACTTPQHLRFKMCLCCEAQCANWSSVWCNDNEFGRTRSVEILTPSKQNILHGYWVLISRGFNQCASQVLDLEQLFAEEAERVPTWKEDSPPGRSIVRTRVQPKYSHQVTTVGNNRPNTILEFLQVFGRVIRCHQTGFDFEFCLGLHGEPQYIRAIQGPSGIPSVDPKFFTLLETLFEWRVHISTIQDLLIISGPLSKEDWPWKHQ